MSFRNFLDASLLRQALLSPDESSSRRFCTNTARLVAAFYLGLPLFDADSYPTLFNWTELGKDELPAPSLEKEEVAAILPSEFSSRLPVVLLIYCGQDLEAVLYSDHFSDRRSSLLLRILVDNSLGLSLTDEYVADFLLCEVARQSAVYPPPLGLLCDQLLPAILELDIVLSRSYIRSLEIHLVDEIELFFAQLPLQSIDIDQLPRPPVYQTPPSFPPSPSETEASVISRIHVLFRMSLSSMHITNRLSEELQRTTNVFAEPDAKLSRGRPLLTRLTVIVLCLIYRDAFSLAATEEWEELPEIAMKYKALIEGEEEEAVARWHSLADEQDLEHVRLFFEFIRNTYQQQSSLPPLDASTRELWHHRICNQTSQTARESPDWVSGVVQLERKLPAEAFQQMNFISNQWRGISFPDPNLISLRLNVTTDVLCRQLPAPERMTQSARESVQSAREDRLFMRRSELVEEYTLKAKEELAKKKMEKKRKCNTHREPRYLRSTVTNMQVEKIAASQAEIRREVESERRFLSIPVKKGSFPSHSLNSSPCSSSSSSPSAKSGNTREDAIRNDIRALNEKIENIGRMLAETPILHQPPSPSNSSYIRSNSAVSMDPIPFEYSQMPAVSNPPTVEKLDFSLLSPNPSARPVRIPTADSLSEVDDEEEHSSDSMDTAKTLNQSSGEFALLRPQSERLPLLSYEKKPEDSKERDSPKNALRTIMTERAVQTSGMTIGEMKPMSRQDISALYRTRQI